MSKMGQAQERSGDGNPRCEDGGREDLSTADLGY